MRSPWRDCRSRKNEVGECPRLKILGHVIGNALHETVLGNLVPVGGFHGRAPAQAVIGPPRLVASLLTRGGIVLFIGALQTEVRKSAVAIIAEHKGAGPIGHKHTGIAGQMFHGGTPKRWFDWRMGAPHAINAFAVPKFPFV